MEGKRTTLIPVNVTQRKIPSYPKNQTISLTWRCTHNVPLGQVSLFSPLLCFSKASQSICFPGPQTSAKFLDLRWFAPSVLTLAKHSTNATCQLSWDLWLGLPSSDMGGTATEARARKGSQGQGTPGGNSLQRRWCARKRMGGGTEKETPAGRLHFQTTSSFTYRTFTRQRSGSRWGSALWNTDTYSLPFLSLLFLYFYLQGGQKSQLAT